MALAMAAKPMMVETMDVRLTILFVERGFFWLLLRLGEVVVVDPERFV